MSGTRYMALPLSRAGAQPLALDGPAGLIWHVLNEGAADEPGVVARVAELADTTADVVEADVVQFLRELEMLGLAERGQA